MMKHWLIFLIVSGPLWALGAFSNPHSQSLGIRSSGMGGAATALLGDVSSAAFYNPATLSQTEGESFSAAAGVYKKFDTIYGGDADYTKTPLRVSTGYFRSIPASTGNVISIGDYKVGLSITVPDYDSFKGDLKNTNTETSTLSYLDESLWVGGAISKKINATDSLGLTLYYTARNFQRSLQDKTYDGSGNTLTNLFTSEETLQQNSLIAILGYYQQLNPDWAWGLALRSSGISLHSFATYFEDSVVGGTSQSRINQNQLSAKNFIPARLSAGLSWQNKEGMTITADASLTEGFAYDIFDYNNKGTQLIYKSRLNVAFGLEQKFMEWFRLRAGLYSNFSAHPDPNPQVLRLQGEKVDQAGFAANLNFLSGKKISYTFGGYWTGGRGQAVIRSNQQYNITTKVQNIFTMLVGTSFYF